MRHSDRPGANPDLPTARAALRYGGESALVLGGPCSLFKAAQQLLLR